MRDATKAPNIQMFSWEQPVRSFTRHKACDSRSEIKLFHNQSRAQLQLFRSTRYSPTFSPSVCLSRSLTPTLSSLLPNYSPIMRTSVGINWNWEVFLSQNKYSPSELHNSTPTPITAFPNLFLFLLYCQTFPVKPTAYNFIVRVSCVKWLTIGGENPQVWQGHSTIRF